MIVVQKEMISLLLSNLKPRTLSKRPAERRTCTLADGHGGSRWCGKSLNTVKQPRA